MATETFQFGAWHVNPADNSIRNGSDHRQVEPRAMDVLVALCKAPNTIISAEQLLEQCWGSTVYGDNPVHKIIAQLRKALGDQSSAPEYIETIRKRGYRTLAAVQYDYSETSKEGTWITESPFRGLQAFDEKHAPIFFGRSDAIFKLTELITHQTSQHASCELIMILGPSGSGKTSLVRAGLIPGLMLPGSAVNIISHSSFDLAEKGEHSLLTTLAGMLLDLEINDHGLFPKYSANTLSQTLLDNPDDIIEPLHTSLAKLPNPAAHRHALFIDRFEAVFDEKSISAAEREGFLKILDKLARSQAVIILLACRNDFYPNIAAYPLLMEAKARGAHFDLNPPSQAELAQMIRLPALAARLTFGIDEQSRVRLDDVLCEGASGNPDALPLLQYTLNELYRMRSDEGELNFAAFKQLGGIEGAIGQRAEQVINALSEAQKECLPQVLSLVTTISANEAAVTSRRAAWALLGNEDERVVVNALVESRLFVSELVDGAPGFGVAHEALLRRWPRVVEWVGTHRNALQIRARIGELARRWQSEANSQDLLLPEGKQLDEARSLLKITTFSLSVQEQALITASSGRVRWRKRLRRTALGAIITLAALASGLGLSALSSQRQALERRVEVEGMMGFMLGDFADKLRPLGRLDLLDSVGAKALDYFARTEAEDLSETAFTQRAKALQVLAEVRITRGDPKAAKDALDAAQLILLKQLALRPKDQEVLKNLGANAFWLGQIHFDKSEWDQATRSHLQRLDYSNRLYQNEPNNVEWWIDQSYAHNNLGTVALKRRDFTTADLEFRQSIDLKTKALAKKPHDNTLKSALADSLSWLSSVKIASGELKVAMQQYQKEASIVQALHQAAPNDGLWAWRWSNALIHQAELKLALGQDGDALADYRQAERLLSRILQQDTSNQNWLHNLAIAQTGIQRSLPDNTDAKMVLGALEETAKMISKTVQNNPNQKKWVHIDATLQTRIALSLLKLGRWSEAEQKINYIEQRLEKFRRDYPSDMLTQKYLVSALLVRANLEAHNKNSAGVQQACQRGRNILSDQVNGSADFHLLDPWLRLHLCLKADGTVNETKKRLAKIDYQDKEYLQAFTLER